MTFKDIDSNRITTSSSSTKLGVDGSMTLDEKLSKILSYLENVSVSNDNIGAVSKVTDEEIVVSGETVTQIEYDFELVSYPYVDYSITPSGNTLKFQWDLNRFISSIPSTQRLGKTSVVISNTNRVVLDSSKPSVITSLSISDFPSFLDVSVRIGLPEKSGAVEYKGSIQLNGTGIEGLLLLEPKNTLSSTYPKTQSELNKHLLSQLELVKSKLQKILNIDLQGKDYSSSYIKTVVEEIISKLD